MPTSFEIWKHWKQNFEIDMKKDIIPEKEYFVSFCYNLADYEGCRDEFESVQRHCRLVALFMNSNWHQRHKLRSKKKAELSV